METNKKNIPEIRFPEFMNDGEWRLDTIETIFNTRNGYTPSKANPLFWENGTIPWFRMEDIRKSGHILSDAIQHITPKAVKGSGLIPAYSIIVATTATIGEHALTIVDSLANQQFTFLTKCKSFESRIDMLYFHYFMFIIDEWCKRNTNAGGLLSVNMDSFKRLVVPYPPTIAEQKRIAECFYSLDKVIESTRQKLEQLKAHKKGLMQKLFPAPGKSVPECRFKEFEHDGEWVSFQLGSIGTTINGLTGKNANDFGKGKPFVTYKQVFDKNFIDFTECSFVNINENEKQNRICHSDVLITMSSETPEEVGYTSVILYNSVPECYLNSFCFIYRLFYPEQYSTTFLSYLFNSERYRTNIVRIAQGITRFNISKTKFLEIELLIPSKDEQEKIGATLYSIDMILDNLNNKLEILERHKQALRQRLFPTI